MVFISIFALFVVMALGFLGMFHWMQKNMHLLHNTLQSNLQHMQSGFMEQFGQQQRALQDMRGHMGGLSESTRHLQSLGQEIAGLQSVLRAPTFRGSLGEVVLEELLRQVLPQEAYAIQYRLETPDRDKTCIVDAMIRLGDKIIPIDSKFPLETFERLLDVEHESLEPDLKDAERQKRKKAFGDVLKKHIDAIATKYIVPNAGTYDFALMYLPAESIYYEAVVRKTSQDTLLDYAARKKIVIVSPHTLYAYLLTVAYGLRGLQIEKEAALIREKLGVFRKHFDEHLKCFDKIGKNIDLAHRAFNDADKAAQKVSQCVDAIE